MDVASLRDAFPRLQMIGGVDKRALARGKDAIDLELEHKIFPTVLRGGYVPTVDHLVPPDVPWPDFVYYRERLNNFLDRGPD
jgi:uroporphyrinogen decarboxylase